MNAMELVTAWAEEVWHGGDMVRAAECIGDTYTRHDAQGNRVVTRDEYIAEIRALRERIPDIHFHMDDFAVSGDRIWTRLRMTGNDVATGRPVNISMLQLYRVEDGRLVETWATVAPEGHDWSTPIE